ncbi:myb family transcription factor EFM [Cinnamomum micranthum f. kanehirae]|uniref:Myb family transcription factor EFM n=1 Tax=Cinnamomum micranthum f. kanehirae TaxID=337451 RepID=A0A443NXA7_9MAGN|nr:myb family transcription factor EFM [Cinnamomum micranthum f. kanehirae]
MGSYSELSLDLNPCYISKMISGFTREVSVIKDPSEKLLKVQDILKSLEEERKKIEAFKRELPFCMVLVIEAIEAVKEEEKKCRSLAEKARPVLEEFMMPVNSKLDGGRGVESEKDNRDKMNWMSSVQLWSDTDGNSNKNKLVGDLKEKPEEQKQSALENSFILCKNKSNGGAFTPFKGFSGFPAKKEEKEVLPRTEISLLSPIIKNPNADSGIGSSNLKSGIEATAFASSSVAATMNIQSNSQQQQHMQIPRKQRRCWSPELHKRFLSALNELGGSQAATPKQIRELMKVDGLTNDEVKSHLQKYRLHTRRLPSSAPATANQDVLVMGGMRGLWVPNVHYQVSKQSTSQGSPQGPLQLSGTSRAVSTTGGDSGEDEDGKSESNSWKSHLGSGEETE